MVHGSAQHGVGSAVPCRSQDCSPGGVVPYRVGPLGSRGDWKALTVVTVTETHGKASSV